MVLSFGPRGVPPAESIMECFWCLVPKQCILCNHGQILASQTVFIPAKTRFGSGTTPGRQQGCRGAISPGVEVCQRRGSGAGLRAGGGMVSQGGGAKPFPGAIQSRDDVCPWTWCCPGCRPIPDVAGQGCAAGRRRSPVSFGEQLSPCQLQADAGGRRGIKDRSL